MKFIPKDEFDKTYLLFTICLIVLAILDVIANNQKGLNYENWISRIADISVYCVEIDTLH